MRSQCARTSPWTASRRVSAFRPDLASCHTAVVEGYVIEGHVPVREIKRLLAEKPAAVKGLAVAGMPLGSPGMEAGGRVQAYQVIAFGDGARTVFATYPAR